MKATSSATVQPRWGRRELQSGYPGSCRIEVKVVSRNTARQDRRPAAPGSTAVAASARIATPEATRLPYRRTYFPAQRLHAERDEPESEADYVVLNDPPLGAPGTGLSPEFPD